VFLNKQSIIEGYEATVIKESSEIPSFIKGVCSVYEGVWIPEDM
jgi:hypothetical protein